MYVKVGHVLVCLCECTKVEHEETEDHHCVKFTFCDGCELHVPCKDHDEACCVVEKCKCHVSE